MPSQKAKILNVALNESLLKSRSEILQRAGYDVVPALNHFDLQTACEKHGDFDLVVIGPALPKPEKRRVMQTGAPVVWACVMGWDVVVGVYDLIHAGRVSRLACCKALGHLGASLASDVLGTVPDWANTLVAGSTKQQWSDSASHGFWQGRKLLDYPKA